MPTPLSMPQLNVGATLTCEPLAVGAGYIGGTAAAIGAAVVTKKPAVVQSAYVTGKALTQRATKDICNHLMD